MYTFALVWVTLCVILFGVAAFGRIAWEIVKLAVVVLFGVAALAIMGCSTMTPEQVEWKRAMDYENWNTCMAVYEAHGVHTVHMDHSHSGIRNKGRTPRWEHVKADLRDNNCRIMLKQAGLWAE